VKTYGGVVDDYGFLEHYWSILGFTKHWKNERGFFKCLDC
jgi:hypothetical protein